jgi:hydrogenase nickel incorporation protein HypB
MCATCGCPRPEVEVESQPELAGPPEHDVGEDQRVPTGNEMASHAHFNGRHDVRVLKLEADVLSENRKYAQQNRRYLCERRVGMLNLVSSPGAGKTTLLTETIGKLKNYIAVAVIEGDQQTSRDSDRIAATGVQVAQINTGKGCHLDAKMVGEVLESLTLEEGGILFVENVGNLVCPADFDLGEGKRVVMLSVTEGDDKPLKYPNIFASSDLMIVTKIDLLPYVDFDSEACTQYARRLNPSIEVIRTSAKTGNGMRLWCDWLFGFLESPRIIPALST